MKRTLTFAKRNIIETLRDPLSLVFCLGFPIVMLVFMELIFGALPNGEAPMFEINNYAPGIASFGYTFSMLFVALTLATDRNSSFMTRILVSPAKPYEYFLSFILSTLPICFFQTVIFYLISLIFGLRLNANLIVSIIFLLPTALFYISTGLLIGVLVKNEKQAGPLSSIIISGAGMLGGVFMPIEAIGGTFLTVSKYLPFYNGVNVAKQALLGNFKEILSGGLIVFAYAVIIFFLSAVFFNRHVKKK